MQKEIQPFRIQESYCLIDNNCITPNLPTMCCIDSVSKCIRARVYPHATCTKKMLTVKCLTSGTIHGIHVSLENIALLDKYVFSSSQ